MPGKTHGCLSLRLQFFPTSRSSLNEQLLVRTELSSALSVARLALTARLESRSCSIASGIISRTERTRMDGVWASIL